MRAETYCNLYSLTREDFQRVLSDFPVMRRTIESIAAERLTQIGRDPNLVSEREDLQDDLQIVKELLQSLAANMHAPNSSPDLNAPEFTADADADTQGDANTKSKQHKKGHRVSSANKDEDLMPGELNPLEKAKRSALARFARVGDLLFHSHDSGSHSRAITPSGERERERSVRASFFLGGRSGSSGGGVRGSGSGERSHSTSDAESDALDQIAPAPPHPTHTHDGGQHATSTTPEKRHHKYRFPHPHFFSSAAAAAKRCSQPSITPKRHNSVNADMPHLARAVGVQLAHGEPNLLASCTALH